MVNTLDRMFAARKFDLSVSLANPYELEKIEEAISNTPGITRAEGWFTTEASLVEQSTSSAATRILTPV